MIGSNISSTSPLTGVGGDVSVGSTPERTTSPKFSGAMVNPEGGSGSTGWMPSAKQVVSGFMALGRWAVTAGISYGVATTVSPVLGPEMGALAAVKTGKAVYNTLAPQESDPAKVLSDKSRVDSLSSMFDNAQSSDKVSQPQKEILQTIDDLGSRAYCRDGVDGNGEPKYRPMTQDEFRAAVLHGAHVVVPGSETLDKFKENPDKIDRSATGKSSHYTSMTDRTAVKREQYGIDMPTSDVGGPSGGNGFGHLLTGKTPNGDTFFQLEGHGTSTSEQWRGHTKDLFSHLNSLANVGPQGVIDMVEGSRTHIIVAPEK